MAVERDEPATQAQLRRQVGEEVVVAHEVPQPGEAADGVGEVGEAVAAQHQLLQLRQVAEAGGEAGEGVAVQPQVAQPAQLAHVGGEAGDARPGDVQRRQRLPQQQRQLARHLRQPRVPRHEERRVARPFRAQHQLPHRGTRVQLEAHRPDARPSLRLASRAAHRPRRRPRRRRRRRRRRSGRRDRGVCSGAVGGDSGVGHARVVHRRVGTRRGRRHLCLSLVTHFGVMYDVSSPLAPK